MGKGQNGAPGLGQGGMIGAALANPNPTGGGVTVADIIRRQNQTRALAPFQTPNGPASVPAPVPGIDTSRMVQNALTTDDPNGLNVTDIISRLNAVRGVGPAPTVQPPAAPAPVAQGPSVWGGSIPTPGAETSVALEGAPGMNLGAPYTIDTLVGRVADRLRPPMIQNALTTDAPNGVNVADIIARLNATRALNPAMAGGPQQVTATPVGSNGPREIADRRGRGVTSLRPTRPY